MSKYKLRSSGFFALWSWHAHCTWKPSSAARMPQLAFGNKQKGLILLTLQILNSKLQVKTRTLLRTQGGALHTDEHMSLLAHCDPVPCQTSGYTADKYHLVTSYLSILALLLSSCVDWGCGKEGNHTDDSMEPPGATCLFHINNKWPYHLNIFCSWYILMHIFSLEDAIKKFHRKSLLKKS